MTDLSAAPTPNPASDAPALSFSRLPLTPATLANLQALGYAQMTPIQAAALPLALAGHDLIAQAATGSGKTWLACALAHQAARSGFSVLYVRAARLFDELQVAHGDGSFSRRLAQLARLDLMVIDDFAIAPMGAPERNDLLELLDDRIGTRSTLITSQLPVKAWHTYLNDPTLADAILDRVVHSSYKLELKVTKSMRDTAEGGASGGLAGA